MTWDTFGVWATLERGFVTSVLFELRDHRYGDPTLMQPLPVFHPSHDFPGRLVLDGIHIDRESDAETLVKYRPRPWLCQHRNWLLPGGDPLMFDHATESGVFLLKADIDFKVAQFAVVATSPLADRNPCGTLR
ncbi:MAG: hypothetical protein KA712_08315 [Myxococcales bacterium]|nr:hypothetical protein [Myxococcales bacterium]